MVGISHVALREVIRSYMPKNAHTIWPTEMLNSRRIPGENLDLVPAGMISPGEKNLVPQILGNEEKHIAPSVKILEDRGAVGIDINMGCPVQKALKHNYGVALMGDVDYAARVVEMTVRNTKLPVSVKLRALGKEADDMEHLYQFTKKLIEAGASWICLHPRTASQVRRGSADWNQITYLKEKHQVSILGNGDIQVADDVLQMLEQTKTDLVMSGRALAARPWLVWQLGERLGFEAPEGREGQRAPQSADEEAIEYGRVIDVLAEKSLQYFGDGLALRKMRFYLKTTSVWLDFGHQLEGLSVRAGSIHEFRTLMQEFFKKPLRMVGRTELRY